MLDEYKQLYKENADLIKNWRKLSKTELCNKYVEAVNNNDVNQESYLSAVIYSFWYIIRRSYYAQQFKLASEEDVYSWYIDGVLCALQTHAWTDPENKLYGNPDGPEKAISVCIYCAKLNFFAALNCDKRKVSKDSLSLDQLLENSSDDYYLPYVDKELYKNSFIYNKVIEFFRNKDYFSSFLLDAIINVDIFSKSDDDSIDLSNRKLVKHLRNLDERYCKLFSKIYGFDVDEVIRASQYLSNLTADRMNRNIKNVLFLMSKDKNLIAYARG